MNLMVTGVVVVMGERRNGVRGSEVVGLRGNTGGEELRLTGLDCSRTKFHKLIKRS